MTLRYCFDQHMPRAIARGLQRRGIDVLTTQDEGTEEWPDAGLFERANELGRVLVTQDPDHIAIATEQLNAGRSFAGLVRAIEPRPSIGRAIDDLETIARCYTPDEMVDRIERIPL